MCGSWENSQCNGKCHIWSICTLLCHHIHFCNSLSFLISRQGAEPGQIFWLHWAFAQQVFLLLKMCHWGFLIGQCGTPFGCFSLYLVGTAAISKYSQWLPSTNQKRRHPPTIRFPGNFWHDISWSFVFTPPILWRYGITQGRHSLFSFSAVPLWD